MNKTSHHTVAISYKDVSYYRMTNNGLCRRRWCYRNKNKPQTRQGTRLLHWPPIRRPCSVQIITCRTVGTGG